MILFLIYQKSEDVFFSKYDQKIILLVLKLLLKYVHLFAIGPPPVNDKGTVHFCTKRNPQKCIKKFRGEIWRRWNYFARSPHNRIPTPAPAGLRSKILWWSPTDTMAETSRTVRVLLHPAQECMHLARIDCLEGFGKKSFENQDISTSPPYGPLTIEGK